VHGEKIKAYKNKESISYLHEVPVIAKILSLSTLTTAVNLLWIGMFSRDGHDSLVDLIFTSNLFSFHLLLTYPKNRISSLIWAHSCHPERIYFAV